ncbi:hypothetical protein K503DRAFT_776934 [Rhizopogon vinicolor AM-OR11-026]|uniref:Uncharacterized protein n=1 Tax=Rhizopogon vinicolor AM-OR11-026 TaxID=1314800 RepID=A0A1B7MHU2_9AGAM|nr:hypothetical protein K503DRAFT_776934 [Rhizopogon vinicolor AM-OR11-026]
MSYPSSLFLHRPKYNASQDSHPANKPSGTHRQVYTSRSVREKPYNSEPYCFFLLKELADVITTFARSPAVLSPVAITNVTPIASYSWIEASLVTIAVPGSGTQTLAMYQPTLEELTWTKTLSTCTQVPPHPLIPRHRYHAS